MSRDCLVRDEELRAFAGGADVHVSGPVVDLDEHVATCDACQTFLAEVWDGGLDHDLANDVLEYLRLEQYLMDVVATGSGLAARMAQAVLAYLDASLGGKDGS
jgi:hypothetical protein